MQVYACMCNLYRTICINNLSVGGTLVILSKKGHDRCDMGEKGLYNRKINKVRRIFFFVNRLIKSINTVQL